MRKSLTLLCFALLSSLVLLAQTRIIKGRVADEKGNPLPGASVQVRGTKTGTTTDAEGNFSIAVPTTAKSLLVSSLNYVNKEFAIGNGNTLAITLKANDASLEEVVVMGYSTVRKTNLTGSVAKVAGAEIENRPNLSFDQALAGKAAGVQVSTSSGLIGAPVNIRVRGASSISSGSQPLIVMDGVPLIQGDNGQLYNPTNALADINPNDIESVEVLKDASAASIYGSRASGGVLMITTKKGKSGAPRITYNSYFGYSQPARMMNVLDGPQYTSVINTMRTNAGLTASAANGDYNGDGITDNTDWQDKVYRKGITHDHQIGISGGSERTTYYASLGFNDFENYIIVNRQKRAAARLNLTTKVTNWFEIGIKSQFTRTTLYGLGSGTGAALSGVPFGPLTAYPNVPVYDATGAYYIGNGGNTVAQNTPNPVAVQNLNYDTRDNRRFINSVYGEISLLKGLKLKSQYNTDMQIGFTDQYWDPAVGDGQGLAGVAQTVATDSRVWSWFNTLNYNTRFGDHELGALAGAEYTKSSATFNYIFGLGLNDPLIRIITPANYATTGGENGIDVNNGLASYFGGINYGYKGKYLASFNIRSDAYSGFGRTNRWGYFPSGSAAWKISQESFWKSRLITDLKLRASYGITGNSNIGNYPSLATFAPTQYANIASLNLNNPGNSNLRWEQTGQFDVGFDMVIGKGINVVIDYYRKKTKDLILDNPILATVGFPGNTITENIGSIEASGFELAVNVPVINKRDFKWNISFNGATNKTKVISTNAFGNDIFGGQSIVRPGYNMSAFYLIRWAGVNSANGMPTFLDVNGVAKQYDHSAPAANRWTRVSDGAVTTAITAADRVVLNDKTPYPKFFGGLSQSFSYKQIDLSFDMQYSLGAYTFNNTLQNLVLMTGTRNKSVEILKAWTKAGDQTDVPRLFFGENQSTLGSTRFLEKADFVRMRNIQIGYTLPKKLLEKAKIANLRVYAQVQNAFTITGYKGMDPESNANGNVNIGLGIDTFRPYLARTFTFGINLGL